ncbi:hypothetical protein IU468_09635 [Nocardia farcinica]|nr:hypothetical protein [Nocardia farcinica]
MTGKALDRRGNIAGSAIALGHPIGMAGASCRTSRSSAAAPVRRGGQGDVLLVHAS